MLLPIVSYPAIDYNLDMRNITGLALGHGWNKGKSADWAKGENNCNWVGGKIEKECQECGKKILAWNFQKDTKKYCSRECSLKHTAVKGGWNKGKHDFMLGEKNHQWKGEKVGYISLHKWVERSRGVPTKCEKCGKEVTNRRKIHWANISGTYKRDLSDYMALCIWCHKKYDHFGEKVSKAKLGYVMSNETKLKISNTKKKNMTIERRRLLSIAGAKGATARWGGKQ